MSVIVAQPFPVGPTPPPTNAGPKRWKWTREQYYKLGELGLFDDKRVELIRGEIFEMSPILMADALALLFAVGFYMNVQQPFAVRGAVPGSEPQPDVAVIPGSRRAATAHPTQAALLVEVADTILYYDTTTKAELYATAGVLDYWVLDLTNRLLHVFRDPQSLPLPIELSTTAYRTHDTLGPNDTIAPLAVPSSAIRVADLLP